MIQDVSISFFLYHYKKNKKTNKVPIYYKIKLEHTGEEKPISTGYFIDPSDWLGESVKTGKGKLEAPDINSYIENLKLKVRQTKNKLIAKDEDFDIDDFLSELTGKSRRKTLIETYDFFLKQMEERINIDYTQSTYDKFVYLKTHVVNFLYHQDKKKDIYLSKLNYAFISDFFHYMKTVAKHEATTIHKEIQRLKQVIILAENREWIEKNPFKGFKNPEAKAEIIYLTEEELVRLETKVFEISRLNVIRDLFVFGCYTSLGFAETWKLKKSNIVLIEGKKWIVGTKQKTLKKHVPYMIPLLTKAEELIKKYENDPRCIERGVLLPVPANQTFNSYLKEIADLCGILKELTTHVARKTFATTIALSNDVPFHIVSDILGHEDLATTQDHYAVVVKKGVGKAMEKLDKKLKKNSKELIETDK